MIYFTADQHFFHQNIIAYTGRPFKSLSEMHKVLIKNYNDKVKPEDTCYFLGDLTLLGKDCFRTVQRIVEQLQGIKILILGNHDKFNPFTYCEMGFDSVHTSYQKHLGVLGLLHFVHDPAACIMEKGRYLVGHCHTLFKEFKTPERHLINVGVDVWGYSPVDCGELMQLFEKRGE